MNSPSSDVDSEATTYHGSPYPPDQRRNSVRTAESAAHHGSCGSSASATLHGTARVSRSEISDSEEPELELTSPLRDTREIPDSQESEHSDTISRANERTIADSQESEPFENVSRTSTRIISDIQEPQSTAPESAPTLRRSRRFPTGTEASRPKYNDLEAFDSEVFEDPEFTPRNSDDRRKATRRQKLGGRRKHRAASDSDAYEDLDAAPSEPEEYEDLNAAPSDREEDDTVNYTPGDTGKHSKTRRSHNAKRTRKRTVVHADADNAPKLEPLLEIPGHERPDSNISRWNKAIGPDGIGIKLTRVVLPTRIAARVDRVRDLLRAPVVDGRRLSAEAVRYRGKWRFKVTDHSRPDYTITVGGDLYQQAFLRNKNEACVVGDKLCRYLERLPLPLATVTINAHGNITGTMSLLQVAVLSDVYDGTDWVSQVLPYASSLMGLNSIFMSKYTEDEDRIQTSIPVITNKGKDGTYITYMLKVVLVPKIFDTNVPIPQLDPTLSRLHPDVIDVQYLRDKNIPSDKHQRYIHTANVLRYVQVSLYGAVGSFRDLQRLKEGMLRPFLPVDYVSNEAGFIKGRYSGPYDSHKLVSYRCNQRVGFVIFPAPFLEKDVEGVLPKVIIKSRSKTRIAFVLQTINTVYYSTGDILLAWRKACELADQVNAFLLTSEDVKMNYCQCSENERETETHICQLCFNEVLCVDLELNGRDNLVCRQCTGDTSRTEDIPVDEDEDL